MTSLFAVVFLSLLLCTQPGRSLEQLPNIILFIADDLGWDGVGYHGSDFALTPNIDSLAAESIVLDSFYSSPLCSPSRASLLTGVHAIHTTLQHWVIRPFEARGLPLDFKILPQYLAPLGYKSHLIGKWHLGFFQPQYTPTRRGFDTHFGYWDGSISYYDHIWMGDGYWGIDFRDNMDLAVNYTGVYATQVFHEKAIERIQEHNTSHPMLLMLSYSAPHEGSEKEPLEAPMELLTYFPHIVDLEMKKYAAMVLAMDHSIGSVMHTLKIRKMLENSIVIFMSDNGAPSAGLKVKFPPSGSNFPLRGSKGLLWEGGVRVPAFIWSPLLQGQKYVSQEMVHITDWLPTLLNAIGKDYLLLNESRMYGVSQWDSLLHRQPSARNEILYNIDPIWNTSAIRSDRFKLLQGTPYDGSKDGWYGSDHRLQEENKKFVSTKLSCGSNVSETCSPCEPLKSVCLFDIMEDPCEMNNIADQHPDIVLQLWKRIADFSLTSSKAGLLDPDPASWPPLHHYAWSSWQSDE